MRSFDPSAPELGAVLDPQAAQKRALAVSAVPHFWHCSASPASVAPHVRQNLPEACAPQDGHATVLM
jgi:hypothetical protein